MMPPSMSVAQDPQSYLSPCQITPNRKVQSSSPSYFGFHSNEGATFLSDANQPHSHQNWSPPSSAVRSTVGVSPNMVPVDRNPDFELFRRQSQEKGFNLSSFGGSARSSHHNAARARPDRTSSQASVHDGRRTPPENGSARIRQTSFSQINAERSSPKRVLSPSADSSDRRASPASFAHDESARTQEQPRFKLPLDNIGGAFDLSNTRRAETLPPQSSEGPDSEQQILATPQHIMTLLETTAEDVLLLDLRVSTQYGESHIDGALNLCIPTTLLKRPSFNVQKLTEIFKDEDQKVKFEKWRNSKYIVVYDASSSLLRDAQTCLNTIKKFRTEGYSGTCYIIKGGFLGFSKRYPGQISYAQSENASSHGMENDGPDIAPVVGGCPMPGLDKPMNPFFGNIRQNMDLIGGVGQIALQHPPNASAEDESGFPGWLNVAASEHDEGKSVSQKFEQIERREKKRMEEALSGDVTWEKSHSSTQAAKVQIAGIEKGAKNRYNNIWPFEHSRVKLQGVQRAECDYFNANYIQSSLSYKRYISTQAPIPATFMDFWNVVWQQDVRVIVMLTAETEGQQVKAHNYWSEKQYGALRLEFLSEKRASLDLTRIRNHQKLRPHHQKRSSTVASSRSLSLALVDSKSEPITTDERVTAEPASDETQPYVTVRRFTLTNERKPFEPMREVVQLQYSAWPDFGAPAHPAHLLGLVEQTDAVSRTINNNVSKSINRTDSVKSQLREPEARGTRPILVHCSAGCGRTGTFCTVDSVIDMLKRQFISKEESAATKMDIDTTPKANRLQPIGTPSKRQQKQTLSPNGLVVDKDLGGPEGDWVHRDDVDLIEQTVEDFRHQRISMVQSLRQYVLCYESIMEWFVEGRRAVNASK